MANGSLTRLFRRALDRLDYWLTQAALSPADAVCGPEPETTADLEERARSGAHLLVIFGGSLVSCVEVNPLCARKFVLADTPFRDTHYEGVLKALELSGPRA